MLANFTPCRSSAALLVLSLLFFASCGVNEAVEPERPVWLTVEQFEYDWQITRPIQTTQGEQVTIFKDGEIIKNWCQSTINPDLYAVQLSGTEGFTLEVRLDGKPIWHEWVEAVD